MFSTLSTRSFKPLLTGIFNRKSSWLKRKPRSVLEDGLGVVLNKPVGRSTKIKCRFPGKEVWKKKKCTIVILICWLSFIRHNCMSILDTNLSPQLLCEVIGECVVNWGLFGWTLDLGRDAQNENSWTASQRRWQLNDVSQSEQSSTQHPRLSVSNWGVSAGLTTLFLLHDQLPRIQPHFPAWFLLTLASLASAVFSLQGAYVFLWLFSVSVCLFMCFSSCSK